MKKKIAIERPKVVVQYRIDAKSAAYILCPANALGYDFYHKSPDVCPELVTNDGIAHKCEFISTWNDVGGVYEDEFESVCQRIYGIPFASIRSMWIGRLGRLDDFWHLIKLD